MRFNPFIFFEKTSRLRALLFAFLILCFCLFVTDFFVKRYVYFEIESTYNFYSIYGFIMFSIIIFGSRLLGCFWAGQKISMPKKQWTVKII